MGRFLSISFPYLLTDWWTIRHPEIKDLPVVVCAPSHGRMIITALNKIAQSENIATGMVLADARAIIPSLHVINEEPGLKERLLKKIAEWCIRFTPVAAVDLPDGIIMDVAGCTYLWGGDENYLQNVVEKFRIRGYTIKAAIADTIGTAWGVARFSKYASVVPTGDQLKALSGLPPLALRLDAESIEKFHKLGLRKVSDFIQFPRHVLLRRFGHLLIQRLNQALGTEEEFLKPVYPQPLYFERLPCLEPIVTSIGIEIALQQLLSSLCARCKNEQKGLRSAILKCFRIDNKIEIIETGTSRPTADVQHLFKLMQEKISLLEPGPGIELFILEAPKVEDNLPVQDRLWQTTGALQDARLAQLIDRLNTRLGTDKIKRFLPDEHYWPERSFKLASSLDQYPTSGWKVDRPRPVQLLRTPEKIMVTAPIPDYPPMLFRYNGNIHKVVRADGPERIEQEWWIKDGEHRDYYLVEDEKGNRYWLFRLGHYAEDKDPQWYLHGFFA